MDYEAGICPKCYEYLLLKAKTPFLICPKCGASISARAANEIVEKRCADADQVNSIIAECVALELKYGSELPFMLLSKIVSAFPHLESPSYLLVKMSDFQIGLVYDYLKTFAGTKSTSDNVPWAESFLDNALDYNTIAYADLFRSYVRNKVRAEKQKYYFDLIDDMVKEYTNKSLDPRSTQQLMLFYTLSSVVNVLLLPIMMLISGWLSQFFNLYFLVNILLALAVLSLEILLMMLHHKKWGNRLNVSQKERLFMLIFMSSLVFAVGAVVMGSVWKITLFNV